MLATQTLIDQALAQIRAGLWGAFQQWAASADLPIEERIYFDDAPTWRRADPVLCAGAAALGLAPEDVDTLFRLAGTQG